MCNNKKERKKERTHFKLPHTVFFLVRTNKTKQKTNPSFYVELNKKMAEKIKSVLEDVGSKLDKTPANKDALIKLLKVLISRVFFLRL